VHPDLTNFRFAAILVNLRIQPSCILSITSNRQVGHIYIYVSNLVIRKSHHSKNHVADFTLAKTYSPRLSKATKSKILMILVIDCIIFKKRNSRER
jgi:hypothetical protein